MHIMNVVDLIKCSKNIVIYGAGFIAGEFWNILQKLNYEEKVSGVVVTDLKRTEVKFGPFEVESIQNAPISPEALICIAVHESSLASILDVLEEKGLSNSVWISPETLVELQIGKVVSSSKELSIDDIIKANHSYVFAIRYLAVEEFAKQSIGGIQIYRKYISYFSSEESAQLRIERFFNLYKDWSLNGYDSSQAIIVDENLQVLDGTHRVTLAFFFKQNKIYADIYKDGSRIVEHRRKAHLNSRDELVQMGLDASEIELVGKAYHFLRKDMD